MPTSVVTDLMSNERVQLLIIEPIETPVSEHGPTRIAPPTDRFAIQPEDLA